MGGGSFLVWSGENISWYFKTSDPLVYNYKVCFISYATYDIVYKLFQNRFEDGSISEFTGRVNL